MPEHALGPCCCDGGGIMSLMESRLELMIHAAHVLLHATRPFDSRLADRLIFGSTSDISRAHSFGTSASSVRR